MTAVRTMAPANNGTYLSERKDENLDTVFQLSDNCNLNGICTDYVHTKTHEYFARALSFTVPDTTGGLFVYKKRYENEI